MDFKQRLTRYMIGLAIGTLVVFIMFPQYDWLSWTPNKTIMKQVREFTWLTSDRGFCHQYCAKFDVAQLEQIRQNGHVDFDKSNPQSNPRRYHVAYGIYAMEVLLTDTTVTLDRILINQQEPCNCTER